jgi:hypothetical protein
MDICELESGIEKETTELGSYTKVPLFRATPITNKREVWSHTQTKSEGQYSLGWKNPRSSRTRRERIVEFTGKNGVHAND